MRHPRATRGTDSFQGVSREVRIGSLSAGRTWGSTADERRMSFPCDRHVSDPTDAYFRAVDVDASTERTFRWLCQLRAAPYSYDWIDNLGRRSPRELTPGLEQLQPGQRVMTIFDLVEFEADRHITIKLRNPRFFGELAVTYLVLARGASASRLIVKLLFRYRRGPFGAWLMMAVFPWPELFMMRKQLLTLKALAEQPPHRRDT
jgi:hypothetical protein